jgi:hypothetical protein
VEHDGRTHAVLFAGETWVAISAGDGEFPDAIEHGSNSRGDWGKLPVESLTRRFRRTVEATWQDEPTVLTATVRETPVRVLESDGTTAHVLLLSDHEEDAARVGATLAEPGVYEARVPVTELVDTAGVTHELAS